VISEGRTVSDIRLRNCDAPILDKAAYGDVHFLALSFREFWLWVDEMVALGKSTALPYNAIRRIS